jgi:hypothetical protein
LTGGRSEAQKYLQIKKAGFEKRPPVKQKCDSPLFALNKLKRLPADQLASEQFKLQTDRIKTL